MSKMGIIASSHRSSAIPILFEPFNNFTDAPWTNSGGSIQTGRTGTACQVTGAINNTKYAIPAPSIHEEFKIGFAYKVTTNNANTLDVLRLYSGASNISMQLSYNGNVNKQLIAKLGGTVYCSSATGLINANTWYYIEFGCRMHGSLGAVEIKLAGSTVASASGLNTNPGAITSINEVRLTPAVSAHTELWDDMYVMPGPGTSFLGDMAL